MTGDGGRCAQGTLAKGLTGNIQAPGQISGEKFTVTAVRDNRRGSPVVQHWMLEGSKDEKFLNDKLLVSTPRGRSSNADTKKGKTRKAFMPGLSGTQASAPKDRRSTGRPGIRGQRSAPLQDPYIPSRPAC